MSSRWSCIGTKPSRKASTSLAVISEVDCAGVAERLEDPVVGFGFGTCGQAERQESASMQQMAEKLRLYIAVIVIIPLRGSKSSVAALALLSHLH